MDSQPIRDERILEALEVCRGGGDDSSDPVFVELAEHLTANPALKRLYDRLRRVDVKLSAAFRDVPVPEGLARRITDRLEAERTASAGLEEAAEPAAPLVTTTPVGPRLASRRRLLVAAGVLSTGAVLLVAALIYISTRSDYTESAVLTEAIDFFRADVPQRRQLLSNAPADYPISRDVRREPGMRWRAIRRFLGHRGVAYDLPGPDGAARATLYVVKLQVAGLKDTQPPALPQRNTGGYCSAAWQDGKVLYVLVLRVPDGRRVSDAYRDCLEPPVRIT